MTEIRDREDLLALSNALEWLQKRLEEDLRAVRQLPEKQIATLLRARSRLSHERADVLIARLIELREVAEARLRTLQRLRARMHQLHGGARPH